MSGQVTIAPRGIPLRGQSHVGNLVNIGTGGALVSVGHQFDVGVRVSITVCLSNPLFSTRMCFLGEIVRVESGPLGLRFLALKFSGPNYLVPPHEDKGRGRLRPLDSRSRCVEARDPGSVVAAHSKPA